MGRIARCHLVEENSINHCTWRSHDHERVFATDEERGKYRELLGRYKERYGILIVSYCLMGTHPHVVCVATQGQKAFSDFWKLVNWQFARWHNRRTARTGEVVMERMVSPQVQDDRHLLETMRYGDLNPVRARIVRSAKDWRWSSHRHYALGEHDELVDTAPAYLGLGRTPVERRLAYRHLFAAQRRGSVMLKRPDLVTAAFIGDAQWVVARLRKLGRSVRPAKSGDPPTPSCHDG